MALQTFAHKRPSPPVEVVHERGRNNSVDLHWLEVALDDGRPYPVRREKEKVNIEGRTYIQKEALYFVHVTCTYTCSKVL